MIIRRLTVGFAIVASILACVLALTAIPALALETHVFSASFGGAGSEAGELSSPAGVAVDLATHDGKMQAGSLIGRVQKHVFLRSSDLNLYS